MKFPAQMIAQQDTLIFNVILRLKGSKIVNTLVWSKHLNNNNNNNNNFITFQILAFQSNYNIQ